MANGDPLRIGLTQPPDNRAESGTVLVQTGTPFGTQTTAFGVLRTGSPICSAAIRGDNFSTPVTPNVMPAGVLGMVTPQPGGIGVFGTASAGAGPALFRGEIGVMGVTNSFGVVGRALLGLIVDDPGTFISGAGVTGQCDAGIGVHGFSNTGWGIIGQSRTRAGVTGWSVSGPGVEARSDQSNGVQATAQSGVGVFGESTISDGVLGRSRDGAGVTGFSEQGMAGVWGRSARRTGVFGESDQGVGVAGVSANNAIQGWSTGSGGASIGVSGYSAGGAGVQGDSNTGLGVCGRSPRGWAGYFIGNVLVQGSFSVTGAKSAVVQHPDGSTRSVFSLECPESYFEDFGEVTLAGESVVVKLDKDFAALVLPDKYQVFLTSYGPEALYVSRRDAGEFEIARVNSAAGEKPGRVQVGYRIVARRADLKPARLPKIKLPAQAPELIDTQQAAPKARRSRARRPVEPLKLDPLPRQPAIPTPDLKALSALSDSGEGEEQAAI